MEDIDVQKLSRKELLQLCADHNIRTAGVKHDDLVRLLQNKLHPPASDPARRATPKALSQISAINSPVSSPKARNQTSADSPFSSPNAKGKPDERPTPGSINQGRSLRPLVLVGDRSRNNSPEPSPRTPRKDQLSPNPGALPRKPTTTKSNAPPAQRSDLLRKKVNTLTAIGKLQAQEKARPSDGRGASGPISKLQQTDRGVPARTRGSGAAAPKKSIKSTPAPAKRPGERAKSNPKEESRNPSSPRVSEGEARVAATAGTHSELGSHSFGSVSEIATDAGRHSVCEDSDADDAQSVSSEPVSRFASQNERFHSPSTLGHGRRSSLESNDAPIAKDADPLQDDDAAFNLIGDAHTLEINSFLNAHENDANAAGSTNPRAPENSIPAAEPTAPIDALVATSRDVGEPGNKPSYDSDEKDDPLCCSGKDSTAECIERVHFNLDSAPLPHPDMERSSMSASLAEMDVCAGKSDLERGSSKDGSCTTKSNILLQTSTDGSEKVPLLQDGRESVETGTTLLIRRTIFPSSILLWCSQLFYAIFGTRSQH